MAEGFQGTERQGARSACATPQPPAGPRDCRTEACPGTPLPAEPRYSRQRGHTCAGTQAALTAAGPRNICILRNRLKVAVHAAPVRPDVAARAEQVVRAPARRLVPHRVVDRGPVPLVGSLRQKRFACDVHELSVFFHVVVQPTVVDLHPFEIVLHQLLDIADVAPVHPTVVAVADVAARLVTDLRARGLNVSAALVGARAKKPRGGRGASGGCSHNCSRTTRAGCPWMPRSRSALSGPGICGPDAARGSDDARSRQQAGPAAAAAAAHLVLFTIGRPSSSWKALALEGITW